MAITPNTTFTAGAILTAAQMNRLPWGILGLATLTSAYTTTGTHTTYQDEGLSTSVTYGPNRILRATFQSSLYPSGGTNRIQIQILRGSTVLKEFYLPPEATSSTEAFDVCFAITFTGPASTATETFKAQIKAGISNTAVSSFANSSRPRTLVIEDLGQA